MNGIFARSFAAALCLCATQAPAATVTTLSVDFEAPAFAVGAIGGNPDYTAGQGGWGHYAAGSISDAQAFSGTQSLLSGGVVTIGATHSLDPATQGDYPLAPNTFPTGGDWWVQAWVWVESGGVGARLHVTPWGWYLGISGTGTPIVESAIPGVPAEELANQGAAVLDQWILLQMSHSTTGDCPGNAPGRCIDFRIFGDDIDLSYSRSYYSAGPNSTYGMLAGDAYWDDVAAGTGEPPTVVPLPGAAWLIVAALGATLRNARRRPAR
jgi:hypothetical protein